MTNKFLVLCTLVLAFHISGCTSNQSQDDNPTVENADVDKIDAEDSSAFAANTSGDAATAAADPSLQAALGEETPAAPPADVAAEPATPPADVVPNEAIANEVAAAPTLDESSLNINDSSTPAPDMAATTNPPAVDIAATNITEATPAAPDATAMAATTPGLTETPVIENSGTNTAMTDTGMTDAPPPPVKKAGGELKKIATAVPYKVDSGWVNAVYVARPGETLKNISQKIYSADKSKELKKIAGNGYLKSRAVKPGDKIYYVSPNRPDDSAKTLFYYEDMGMMPETYVAKKGDTLKKVAKNILGYSNGSVELWSANPVESKSKLNEGETLRYWRSASGVTSTVAANNGTAQLVDQNQMTLPPQPEMPAAPTMEPAAAMPPPPPTDHGTASATATVAANTPPPSDTSASLPPPPPPPPPSEMAPPPPPVDDMAAAAPKEKKKKTGGADEESAETTVGGLDSDTMMSLGAVGVLTAALAFVLIRRKKKKAESASMMGETHLG